MMNFTYKKVGKSEGHEYRVNLEHKHSTGRVEKETVVLASRVEEQLQGLIEAVLECTVKSTQIVLKFPNETVSIDLKPDDVIKGQVAKVSIDSVQYFYCDCEFKVIYTRV